MATSGPEVSERDVHARLQAAAAVAFGNFVDPLDNNSNLHLHLASTADFASTAPHLSSFMDSPLQDQCSTTSEKFDNSIADIAWTAPHLSSLHGPLQDQCSTATDNFDNIHGELASPGGQPCNGPDHAVVAGPNSDMPPPDGPWGSRRGASVAESVLKWNQSPPKASVTFASPVLLADGTASVESSDHSDFDKEMSPDSLPSTAASNLEELSSPGIGEVSETSHFVVIDQALNHHCAAPPGAHCEKCCMLALLTSAPNDRVIALHLRAQPCRWRYANGSTGTA